MPRRPKRSSNQSSHPQPSHDARPFPSPEPHTRNAGSTETRVCPPAAAPDSCGGFRREAPLPREGKEWKCEEGGQRNEDHTERVSQKRLHLGGRRRAEACLRQPQPRRHGGLRVMEKRPSDRRSPGRNPGPQGAFEVSMINVSCNSH